MKKITVSLVLFLFLTMTGCSFTKVSQELKTTRFSSEAVTVIPSTQPQTENIPSPFAIPITELPKKYTPEDAAANGDYVNVHGQLSNEYKLTEFLEAVYSKNSAAIRVVNYTTEGDPIIADIIFDTSKFTVINDATRDIFGSQPLTQSIYKNILEYKHDETLYVFLTNLAEITEDLFKNGFDGYPLVFKKVE